MLAVLQHCLGKPSVVKGVRVHRPCHIRETMDHSVPKHEHNAKWTLESRLVAAHVD